MLLQINDGKLENAANWSCDLRAYVMIDFGSCILKLRSPEAMIDLHILDLSPLFADVRSRVWSPFKPEIDIVRRVID